MPQVIYEQEQEQNLTGYSNITRNSNKNRNHSVADFGNIAVWVSKAVTVFSIAYLMWAIGTVCICWDIMDLPYSQSQLSLSFCSNISPKNGVRKFKSVIQNINGNTLMKAGNNQKSVHLQSESKIQNSLKSESVATNDKKILSLTSADESIDQIPPSTFTDIQNTNKSILQQIEDQKDVLQNSQNQKNIELPYKITNQRYLKLISQFQPPNFQPLQQSDDKTDKKSDLERRRTLSFLSKIERQEAIDKYLESVIDQKSLYLQLASYNDQNNEEQSTHMVKRMKWLPSFDQYQQKNTFCVIVSTYNNANQRQITRTLNSISNQQYEKYHVVVTDGSSTDGTMDIIREYLNQSLKLSNRTVLVEGQIHNELKSIYDGLGYCNKGQIAILMNGEGELLGTQVFKLTDYTYSLDSTRVVYSDAYTLDLSRKEIEKVRAERYDESQKFMNMYRDQGRKYGYYFSFDRDLLDLVDKGHLTDSSGNFFVDSENKALLVSLLQVSCGDITYLSEPLLLHNFQSNLSKFQLQRNQKQIKAIVHKSKLYFC